MKVFKFGGASVKDAAGVRNVAKVLSHFPDDDLLIVVSAMGKTTNALEEIVWGYCEGSDVSERVLALKDFHRRVLVDLVGADADISWYERKWADIDLFLSMPPTGNVDRDYDRIVSLGEIWSSSILRAGLLKAGFDHVADAPARQYVRTDSTFRAARVDWEQSEKFVGEAFKHLFDQECRIIVTQGFIGSSGKDPTTLGREGSDFSAAIFAYLLNAESVTIWKDVPGMFNADPKLFPDTKLLSHISYREAIELSYFGASVIHPRTLQPLQKKHIPLYVRSFVDLGAPGSTIDDRSENDSLIPSFIIKPGQVLISITPRDLAFIVEENLSGIFALFARHGVRINLMQNSAVAFTVCVDNDNRVKPLVLDLRRDYEVRWNEDLELVTVRHFDDATLAKLTVGKEVLIEQRSRNTARFVVK